MAVTDTRIPRVSVGMPVYNGENFIKHAIDSVLAQSFTDLELIISDNASTDATQAICESYTEKDQRVHYYRNPTNLGLFKNYNRVFELSKGEYFFWMAHDDSIAPNFLRRAIEILDRDPSILLCYGQELKIDSNGEVLLPVDFVSRLDSTSVHVRVRDVLIVPPISTEGLIRANELRKTQLNLEFIGSDWNLAFELALLGRFFEIPERLYFRRSHPQSSMKMFPKHERMAGSNPSKAAEISFPTWRQTFEYFRSVQRFPLFTKEKLLCDWELLKWVMIKRTRIDLLKDLKMAIKKIVLRSRYGDKIYRFYRSNHKVM